MSLSTPPPKRKVGQTGRSAGEASIVAFAVARVHGAADAPPVARPAPSAAARTARTAAARSIATRYGAVKTLAVLLAAVAALLLAPAAARADGDPASDILLVQDVFVTYSVQVPTADKAQLEALVAAAKRAKVPLKVALIAAPADLGAVPSLFGKPKVYAQFLGREIYNIYPGRLLVVMPDGYGVSSAGAIVEREQRVVDALPKPGSDGAALASAAQQAIRRVATLHGKRLPAAPAPPSSGGGHATRDRLEILAIALCGLAIVAIFAIPRRRRRRTDASARATD